MFSNKIKNSPPRLSTVFFFMLYVGTFCGFVSYYFFMAGRGDRLGSVFWMNQYRRVQSQLSLYEVQTEARQAGHERERLNARYYKEELYFYRGLVRKYRTLVRTITRDSSLFGERADYLLGDAAETKPVFQVLTDKILKMSNEFRTYVFCAEMEKRGVYTNSGYSLQVISTDGSSYTVKINKNQTQPPHLHLLNEYVGTGAIVDNHGIRPMVQVAAIRLPEVVPVATIRLPQE